MKTVALDFETYLVTDDDWTPKIVGGVVASENGEFVSRSAFDLFRRASLGGERIAVAFGAFDFACLVKALPRYFAAAWELHVSGRVHDVLIGAQERAILEGRLFDNGIINKRTNKLLKSGTVYDLASAADEYLGITDAKKNDEYRLRYAELDHLPLEQWPEVAVQYMRDDGRITREIALLQPHDDEHVRQVTTNFCLYLSSAVGLAIDKERVKRWDSELKAQKEKLAEHFSQYGFYEYDKKNRKYTRKKAPIQKRVTEAYRGEPPLTKSGIVSEERTSLEHSGDPLLVELAKVSKIDTEIRYANTLQKLKSDRYRVRANVLLATGRVSYSGLIQTMPRAGGARDCCVASPGTTLCSTDYSSAEAYTLAQVCLFFGLDSKLAKALNEGKDTHVLLGAQLLGREYDELKKASKVKGSPEAEIRQAMKAANYGFPGLMSAATFVAAKRREGLSICEKMGHGPCGQKKFQRWLDEQMTWLCCQCVEDASKIRANGYIKTWTEMPEYWRIVQKNYRAGPITQFISGRKRLCRSAPAAANSYFQGLAADMVKHAVRQMTFEMYIDNKSPLFGCRLLVFTHDETIVEMPEETAHEAAMRQSQIMLDAAKIYLPDMKTIQAEPALMHTWDKNVEAKYDGNGRLIPWN